MGRRPWGGWLVVALVACQGKQPPGAPAAAAEEKAALGTPTVPAVTSALSAENTLGFAAFENLDALGAEAERVLTGLPRGALAQVPESLRDPAARRATLGFDATRADGWSAVGLDARGGLALAFDRRLGGRPVIVLRLTDEGKLRAALAQKGVVVAASQPVGALEETRIDGTPALVARRGGWTLVLPEADVARDAAALTAMAQEDAPLSDHGDLRAAFSDGISPVWISAWAASRHLATLSQVEPAAFYAERFPAVGFAFGAGQGAVRVLAAPAGLAALKKLFVPDQRAPDFSKNLNEVMALRLDINFGQFFEGLGELIAPSATEALQSLSLARVALPQVVGFTLEELDLALTGHVLVQYKTPAPGRPPQAAVALGVADAARTDEIVDRVVKLVTHRSGLAARPVQVAGRAAVSFSAGPFTVVALRVEHLLWLGDQATVEAALASGGASAAIGQKLNQPAAFAALMNIEALAQLAEGTLGLAEGAAEAHRALWKPYLTEGWLVSTAQVDARGLRLGEGAGGAALPGVLAAVAIPAFVKYTRRAQVAEASVHLRRLSQATVAYHTEHGRLPAPAPLTPSAPACVAGKPVTQLTDSAQWAGAWQALGFEPFGKIRYQYEYLSDGQSFTARALGDLDCDGVRSTFERSGRLEADGTLTVSPDMFIRNELE